MKHALFLLAIFVSLWAKAEENEMVVYPNPFTCAATIKFDLEADDTVSLFVFDRWGRAVKTYFDHTALPSGSYLINLFGDSLEEAPYVVAIIYGDSQRIAKHVIKLGSCQTTSIEHERQTEMDIKMLPNPSSVAGCQLSVASELVGGNLEVYDANGSVVFQSKISNLKSEISLPVPAGVYFVHISSERGSVVKKLIRL